jgi:hypothetical protein
MTAKNSGPSASAPGAEGQNPALVRALRIAVIGMGLLIVLGLGAVIWRIVQLASNPKPAEAPAVSSPAAPAAAGVAAAPLSPLAPEIALALPAGASVRSMTMSANRLAVHYEAPAGGGIVVIDLETGRTLTQVRLTGP